MKINYAQRLRQISPFVKITPKMRKNKGLITRYYNILNTQGYFNREQEGYLLKNIERTSYKVKGAPKIKKIFAYVGTEIDDEKNIITDRKAKVKIRKGQIFVERAGALERFEFQYNIRKNWSRDQFIKHLQKQLGQKKLRKNQFVTIGAGFYEMYSTATDSLEGFADRVLKMSNGYLSQYKLEKKKKHPADFMFRAIVYNGERALVRYQKSKEKVKKKPKRKDKYSRVKGR